MLGKSSEFRKKVAQAASLYCKGHGITHKEIADKLGLSKSQIDNWFSRGTFTFKGIEVLKKEFGLPAEIFEKGEYTDSPVANAATRDLLSLLVRLELRVEKLEQAIEKLSKPTKI